jgi:hypothetical protein
VKANGWTRDLSSGRAEPGSRKFGSRGGSREPARRVTPSEAAIVDAAAACGIEVVRSHRRDIDALRGAAAVLEAGEPEVAA